MNHYDHIPRKQPGEGYTVESKISLLRPVALFLDGMSRAAILSFGPSLVYRLTFGSKTGKLGLNVSIISYPFAIVVAAFLVGRFIGGTLAAKLKIVPDRLPRFVARLSGITIALQPYSNTFIQYKLD